MSRTHLRRWGTFWRELGACLVGARLQGQLDLQMGLVVIPLMLIYLLIVKREVPVLINY